VGGGFPPPVDRIVGYGVTRSTDGVQLVDCHNVVELDFISPCAIAEWLAECIGGQSAELIAAAGVVRGAVATSPSDGDATAEQAEGNEINGGAELDGVERHGCLCLMCLV